ncbi:hypothetical protein AB6A40_001530 [Gnathostoma spinigerum]|uniref:Mediator of RNA polymerase II transcription subunit 14 n=1 Tax=Gnathostoma spinigerum TaxID=75299 RepID=A0ABD6E6N5_9BILA
MEDEEEYMKPMLPTVPEKCGPPVIELGRLIEFAVQQILHEMTVLSELLPKKLDADRKISIVQFAHGTRTLFIKLLSVVKWVKSSKKFESCSSICYFLDQQAQYFVDTADRLVQLSREELVHARLPAFQVPSAVDVLTLGTYPRLPLCIKSRFIPEPPITNREQACILARLNQVIQSRLSSVAARFSPRIKQIIIKNGILTLTVPGEFDISLTLLGQRPTTKWTLLNINILVEDYEIGFGTKLVHPLQVNMLHNVLQLRMDKHPDPLLDAYRMLHSFAQSLQLDVLYCQATQLISGKMCEYASIDRYDRSEGVLSISYWTRRNQFNRLLSQYRFTIFSDSENSHVGLRTRHYPVAKHLPQLDDRTGRLSISRLLSETVEVRCRERLIRVKERFEYLKPHAKVKLTGKATPTLTWPLLGQDSHEDEMLVLSVNSFSGRILAIIRALGRPQELCDVEKLLDESSSSETLTKLTRRLRILLMMERYRKAVAPLPVRIENEKAIATHLTNVQSISPDRICLQFIKEDLFHLIVSFTPSDERGVDIDIHLLSTVEGKGNMVQLHPSQMLSSASLSDFTVDVKNEKPLQKKRLRWLGSTKALTSAVSTIDDRLAFMRICEELDRRGVKYRSLAVEPTVGGLLLHITDFSGAIPSGSPDFFSSMVNCCLRLDTRTRVIWPFECTLVNTPLISDFYENSGTELDISSRTKTTVIEIHGSSGYTSPNTSESVSLHMLDRLVIFSHMYDPVKSFAPAYYKYFHKYCNIVAFTYHKLVLAYGAKRDQLMILSWRNQKTNNPKPFFYLTFGMGPDREIANRKSFNVLPPKSILWNPHILLQPRLQERFNRKRSLIDLVQYLIDTISPLSALHGFARLRLYSLRSFSQIIGIESSFPVALESTLVIMNEYTVRLIYGPVELEFLLLGNSRVGVRDCTRGSMSACHLSAFCNRFISAEFRQIQEERSSGGLSWMFSPSASNSVPPCQMGQSPASRLVASPMSHASLSVPPADRGGSPFRISSSDHPTRSPIMLDHIALQKMTSVDEYDICPLNEYLFALTYLYRLGPCLEAYRREHRGSNTVIQFRRLISNNDSVRISIVGAASPALNHEPFLVNMNIYLDINSMNLKMKLDFEGDDIPMNENTRIAECYFEQCVARLNNELAVVAFMNACRLTMPGAFAAVTQIMSAQMVRIQFVKNFEILYNFLHAYIHVI